MAPQTSGEPGRPDGPSIAIIGTEGSGKTVLAAALARHLGGADTRGLFLNPLGVGTMRYVERIWRTLQGGEWPPSTPPGDLFQLRWKLRMTGEPDTEVRLVDAAGQDLRLLFGEEKIHQVQDLPDALRKLAGYCRSAEIVLFLINLQDFEGQADPMRRTDNEAAIKGAMDYLGSDGRQRRYCVVLTQADLYRETARQRGGWLDLAAEMIPYISGAYLRTADVPTSGPVPVFPVSAVNRTRIVVDEQGIARRVPDPPFGSDGLDTVVEWMTAQVREIHRDRSGPASPPPVPPPLPTTPIERLGRWLESRWRNVAAGVVCLAILRSCSGGCGTARPSAPVPVVTEAYWQDHDYLFEHSVTSYGFVRNNGAAGNVVVTSWVIENGREVDRRSQRFFLNAGQTERFSIDLPGIYDIRNSHEVRTSAGVP